MSKVELHTSVEEIIIVFDITYLTKIQKFLNPLLRKTDSLS
jgi:hypothetical protein